jgi:quinol-cytochrome oxidoreductase complex cytochrome b subunit
MPNGPLLTIDFGSIFGSFHATANSLPAIAALVVMVMGIVIGAAFVSSRRRRR